ncbi:MAG TPA: bifunctional ADP-heptose synthase [Bacillota bacterium]|nr:bifunctional ADP-heptose synthase [Bacillota bacterium]
MSFLENFHQQRIMVFGDIIADIYEFGTIHRLSREAPVPIVEFDSERMVPGGAGNVATNIAALKGQVVPVSLIGEDEASRLLLQCLAEHDITTKGILQSSDMAITTKRRVLAQGIHTVRQQVIRLDRLPRKAAGERDLAVLMERFNRLISEVDAVVISDYNLPIIPRSFYKAITDSVKEHRKITIVDSRRSLLEFKGVTLLTPNREEAEEIVGRQLDNQSALEYAGRTILERTECKYLLITLGDQGMALFQQDQPMVLIPVFNRQEVFDVSGAGDTVVAAVTLGLLSGLPAPNAARLANIAAGLVVRKLGTATVSLDELAETLSLHPDLEAQLEMAIL